MNISLMAGDGTTRATVLRQLAANASFSWTPAELFGTNADSSDYVRIAANGDIAAAESISFEGRWLRALAGQSAESVELSR